MAASDESIRGLGETQQAEMAMGDKGTAPTSGHEQTGGPKYPAGTGGHYPSSPDAPMGRASSGESFTSGVRFGEGPTEQPREQMVQAAEPKTKGNESGRTEEMASRAGETFGRALRMAATIGKEMSSGIRKGMGREK